MKGLGPRPLDFANPCGIFPFDVDTVEVRLSAFYET